MCTRLTSLAPPRAKRIQDLWNPLFLNRVEHAKYHRAMLSVLVSVANIGDARSDADMGLSLCHLITLDCRNALLMGHREKQGTLVS